LRGKLMQELQIQNRTRIIALLMPL